jgi:hypothetical protein
VATVLNTVANRVQCKKRYIAMHRPNFFADNIDKKDIRYPISSEQMTLHLKVYQIKILANSENYIINQITSKLEEDSRQ